MPLRDLIAAAPLPSAYRLALVRAVPALSDVQLGQLGEILPTHASRLEAFFDHVWHDATLTPQARIEYAIHEVAKELRAAAEAAQAETEAAEMERLLREM